MSEYILDKDNPLRVKGWGVFRNSPWHFDGLFPTRAEAEARLAELGEGYAIAFGSRRLATDDFVFSESDQP